VKKIQQTIQFGRKYIDYKMAIYGAFVMGSSVFCINYFSTYDLIGSITASLKQGSYTFLFGGILMRGCEYLATRIETKKLAITAAVLIPSVFTLILTFSIHSMKGTPKPLESTFPTLIIIPATLVWGIVKRNEADK
jgi:hypothetical protein